MDYTPRRRAAAGRGARSGTSTSSWPATPAGGPEAVRNHYSGIARFYRALFYFDKVKTYGDVPWIDQPLDVNDSTALFAKRDKRDVVMTHVLEDLDFAFANIRTETDASRTQITKDVVLAWKSRIALFEGTFRKYHASGLATGLESSVPGLLQQAAAAAQQVITAGKLQPVHGRWGEQLLSSVVQQRDGPGIRGDARLRRGCEPGRSARGELALHQRHVRGRTSFVRPFINTYLNIDGTPFTDTPGHDTLSFMSEVRNRDKRLQQTIRLGNFTRLNAGVTVASPPLFSQTLTGYQPIKWTVDDVGLDAGANNTNDITIMRYAEVLLNFAEAKAELGTITADDWGKTVGALRARAGITGGLAALPTRADPYLQATYFPNVSNACHSRDSPRARDRAGAGRTARRRLDPLEAW